MSIIRKMSIISKIALIVATVMLAASIGIISSPKAKEIRNINLGNKYLTDMDYESAKVAYDIAISIDPNSKEALEGLMQVAYATDDYDSLNSMLPTYVNTVINDEKSSEEDIETITKMVRASYSGFDSAQEYANFVNNICSQSDSADLDDLRKEALYASAAASMNEGDYENANIIMDSIVNDYPDEDANDIKANVLEKCAEDAWKKRDFEVAYDYLKQALDFAKDNSTIKDDLLRVIDDYATECKNNQNYELANELVEWLQELRGDDALSGVILEIAEMEEADNALQVMIGNLNAYFDNDDIEAIASMMLSDEFKQATSKIRRVLYSDSLKGSEKVNGHGTAIYNDGGEVYVYYGDYVDGKRSGDALWYTTDEYGRMSKYTLNWVDDVPNGEGTNDFYSMVRHYDTGARTLTHMKSTFSTVNGVYEGVAHKVWVDNEYGANYDIVYHDGYMERIEGKDVPKRISRLFDYPIVLSAYFLHGDNYAGWYEWNSGRDCIEGLNTKSDDRYAYKGIKLEFE